MAILVRKMMIKHWIVGVPKTHLIIVCVQETDPSSLEEAHFES